MESDEGSFDKDGGPESRPNTHSLSVDIASMVPQAVQATSNLPAEDQATKQSIADDTGRGGAPASFNTVPGHVAYLQQHRTGRRISREGTDLLPSICAIL